LTASTSVAAELAGKVPVVKLFCLSSVRHGVEHRGGLCSICSGSPLAGTALLAQDNARLRVFMSVRISTVTFFLARLGDLEFENYQGDACQYVRACGQTLSPWGGAHSCLPVHHATRCDTPVCTCML